MVLKTASETPGKPRQNPNQVLPKTCPAVLQFPYKIVQLRGRCTAKGGGVPRKDWEEPPDAAQVVLRHVSTGFLWENLRETNHKLPHLLSPGGRTEEGGPTVGLLRGKFRKPLQRNETVLPGGNAKYKQAGYRQLLSKGLVSKIVNKSPGKH